MITNYIFKSERLGFRNWDLSDVNNFAEINTDPEVMQHFPATLSLKETSEFIVRLQKHYKERGHNYFATEILETGEFIGFIGLAYQNYETDFNPAVDIGWRLKKSAWGFGYATEGARRCLEFAFDELNLIRIIATCTVANTSSENVMKKIGMTKKEIFKHPLLKDFKQHEMCVLYEIQKNKQHD